MDECVNLTVPETQHTKFPRMTIQQYFGDVEFFATAIEGSVQKYEGYNKNRIEGDETEANDAEANEVENGETGIGMATHEGNVASRIGYD
jgi:hypothetical protein